MSLIPFQTFTLCLSCWFLAKKVKGKIQKCGRTGKDSVLSSSMKRKGTADRSQLMFPIHKWRSHFGDNDTKTTWSHFSYLSLNSTDILHISSEVKYLKEI